MTADIYPLQVIALYKQCMQVEVAIRDIKNTHNGFSLRRCRSALGQGLNVALLLAALAMLLLWIVATVARQQEQIYPYRAITIRHCPVLSTFTRGWQPFSVNCNRDTDKLRE